MRNNVEESAMVLESARPRIKSLPKLATDLNEASDRFTDELRAIEGELERFNLGIEVFLKDPLKETHYQEAEDDRGGVHTYYFRWHLGYGKYHGKWCLLIREFKVVKEYDLHLGGETWVKKIWDETPLLQTSRESRIAAAENILDLLAVIEKAVEEKIAALKKVSDTRQSK